MARKAHKPSEKERTEAQAYAAVGIPHDQIALLLGISPKTLRKHYRHELDLGKAKANAQVGKTLFKMATSGKNPAATIYWTKSQMGWSERYRIEHSGPDGGPLQSDSRIKLETLITPERAAQDYLALMGGMDPVESAAAMGGHA